MNQKMENLSNIEWIFYRGLKMKIRYKKKICSWRKINFFDGFWCQHFFFQQMYKIVVSEKKKEWPDDSSRKKISRLLFWLHFLFHIPLPFLALPLESLIIMITESRSWKRVGFFSSRTKTGGNSTIWELPSCTPCLLEENQELVSEITQHHPSLILFIQSPDHIQEKGNQIQLPWKDDQRTADMFESSTAEVKSCLKVRTIWKWNSIPTHNFSSSHTSWYFVSAKVGFLEFLQVRVMTT